MMIRIKEFYLEESKVNKGLMILVAYDINEQKWVCSGNHYSPLSYIILAIVTLIGIICFGIIGWWDELGNPFKWS